MSMGEIVVCFAGSAVRIGWDCEQAESLVEFVFGAFQRLSSPDSFVQPHEHFMIHCYEPDNCLFITSSCGENFQGTPQEMSYLLAERVTYHLADRSSGGLLLHAAGMALNGNALILPGVSGSGKSTLALWLEQHGFDFLTDELLFIPEGTLQCQGLIRPMNLKKIIREVTDKLPSERILSSDSNLRLLVRSSSAISSANIRFIVFPRYTRGTDFEYRRLSGAEAALALTRNLVNARNLPENGFPELLRLARTIPAYHMEYENLDSVYNAINNEFSTSAFIE